MCGKLIFLSSREPLSITLSLSLSLSLGFINILIISIKFKNMNQLINFLIVILSKKKKMEDPNSQEAYKGLTSPTPHPR